MKDNHNEFYKDNILNRFGMRQYFQYVSIPCPISRSQITSLIVMSFWIMMTIEGVKWGKSDWFLDVFMISLPGLSYFFLKIYCCWPTE